MSESFVLVQYHDIPPIPTLSRAMLAGFGFSLLIHVQDEEAAAWAQVSACDRKSLPCSSPIPLASFYGVGKEIRCAERFWFVCGVLTDSQPAGDVVHLHGLGLSIVLLNSMKAVNDLLDRRATIYSHRPVFPMVRPVDGSHSCQVLNVPARLAK